MSEMFSTLASVYQTRTAVIRGMVQAVVNGVAGVKTYPRRTTAKCFYYKGSMAEQYIADSLRASVSGVVLFNPDEVNSKDIKNTDMIDVLDSTIAGAVNHTGGYSTGTTTIVVDGFTDSSYPIKARDLFTIAGETGSTEHEVVSTVRTANVTTSITFTPALSSNITDDAVVTVLTYDARLAAIHGDNVAFQDMIVVVPVKEFS